MASSSPARAPLAAVSDNAKRKDEDRKPPSMLSPYEERIKLVQDCANAAINQDKVLMSLEQLGVNELEELDDEQYKAAYSTLTEQEIYKYLQVMVVDRELFNLQDEYYNEIRFADPRNNKGDRFIMLNTYSSWCMYPVINKLLTNANKQVNRAKKAVETSANDGGDTKNMRREMRKALNTKSCVAGSEGVALVEDKQVKIVQIFQVLVTSPTSGIVYDSSKARNVKAYWVTPNGSRYEITVEAIIPNKCMGKLGPMPRLVQHETHGFAPGIRTGFGKLLYAANDHLQGDRQGPSYILMVGTDPNLVHDTCQARPIANANGTVTDDFLSMPSLYWTLKNVATAGPP